MIKDTNDSCCYCNSCDSCCYCGYCYSCNYCHSCCYCNSCNSCNYCNYCYSCNSCNSCVSCVSCNSCNYCYYCNSCKNLKMTENNLFCYSKAYGDVQSKQQNDWRVFNKQVTESRYNAILKAVKDILPQQGLEDYWKSVTQKQWKQLLAIPEANDFKNGFEYISGCKIETCQPLSGKEVTVTLEGKTYKAIIV